MTENMNEESIETMEVVDSELEPQDDVLEEEVDIEEIEETEDSEDDSDEVDLDEIADTAIDVLQMILKPFDIGDITIDEYEGDEGELILDITGADLAVLIGRHGRTLDSLQFIVSSIVRKKLGFHYPVVVDVEGYKSRQRQKIESIAQNAANRAVSRNQSVALRPMNPYERRIVHMILKDDDRVETESESEGMDRHVVIYPL